MSKNTIEEKAGMIMACFEMTGIAKTRGEVIEVLRYIFEHDDKFFAPPKPNNQPIRNK